MYSFKKLETVRSRNGALKAERESLRTEAPNVADVRASLTARLRAEAESSDRSARAYLLNGGYEHLLSAMPKSDGSIDLTRALVRLLGPDVVAEHLLRHVADMTTPLTATKRQARLAEIERELFEAECAEEQLIEASEAAGTPVARRADADPRAVLGVV